MDRVFAWISRINSVLLLLLILGAGGLAAWNWLHRQDRAPRRVVTPIESNGAGRASAQLLFGEAETITGSDTIMIPLGLTLPAGITTESIKLSSGPRHRQETRNVLFLAGTGQHIWLFDTNNNFVRAIEQVGRDSNGPSKALYLEFATADTNGDRVVNRDDGFTVAFAKPDGSGMSEIVKDVSGVLAHKLADEETMALVYLIGKQTWHARYRLSTFEKLSEQPVGIMPAGQ